MQATTQGLSLFALDLPGGVTSASLLWGLSNHRSDPDRRGPAGTQEGIRRRDFFVA